jgi:hypothetical protein
MMHRSIFLTALVSAIATVSAVPLTDLRRNTFSRLLERTGSTPLPPSQDPFYTPDGSAWREVLPGTILKQRDITTPGIGNLTSLANLQNAYQLLYRTTDAYGSPSYTVTTILKPFSANANQHMSYQPATDSPDKDCAPSYGLQAGSSTHAYGAQSELNTAMSVFLDAGVIVSVPDSEGPQSAFTVGPESAMGVLDSIRAVLRSGSLKGVSPNATNTLVGYSGGAIASEWAAEFHMEYAPELKIAGAAIGGLPTNISKTLISTNAATGAGLIASSLLGIAARFPEMQAYLDKHLVSNKELFNIPLTECQTDQTNTTYGYGPALANKNILSWFDNGMDIINDQQKLLDAIGVMGLHGTPSFPMYIWKSTTDEVVPDIEDTDALVVKYCSAGTNIEYVRFANSTHIETYALGFPGAVKFIGGIYDGIVPTSCTVIDKPGLHG